MPKRKAIPETRPTVEPFRVSVAMAAYLLGFSRSQLYKEIRAGKLRPVKVGNKTLLTMTECRRYSAVDDPVNLPIDTAAEPAPVPRNARGDNKSTTEEDLLLTRHEAAAAMRLSIKVMDNWRTVGRGPKFLKLGGRVLYPRGEIKAFMVSSLRQSTSAPAHIS